MTFASVFLFLFHLFCFSIFLVATRGDCMKFFLRTPRIFSSKKIMLTLNTYEFCWFSIYLDFFIDFFLLFCFVSAFEHIIPKRSHLRNENIYRSFPLKMPFVWTLLYKRKTAAVDFLSPQRSLLSLEKEIKSKYVVNTVPSSCCANVVI